MDSKNVVMNHVLSRKQMAFQWHLARSGFCRAVVALAPGGPLAWIVGASRRLEFPMAVIAAPPCIAAARHLRPSWWRFRFFSICDGENMDQN